PRFIERALAGQPLEIFGDGTQTRCFCHVVDTIRALYDLMEDGGSGEIYNVGSQERIRIIDLANRVIELTGSRSELVFGPFEESCGEGIEDMLHRIPAMDRVHGATGWEPTIPLERILEDVVASLRERASSPS